VIDRQSSIALVVAVADNGVIGLGGKLPWHLPDDLKHFKQVTLGKPVVMGRRTYESIGRPLPGRRNLVLSRSAQVQWPQVETVSTLEAALSRLEQGRLEQSRLEQVAQVCVIGGAEVFALALPLASCVYLTQVHGSMPGDTFFPLEQLSGWREAQRTEHGIDERHRYAMSFVTLLRDKRAVSIAS
jgi:dihydrofolate reductase